LIEDHYEFAKYYSENIENLLSLGNGGRKLNKIDEKVIKLEEQNKDLIEKLAETNKKVDLLTEIIGKTNKFLYNEYSRLVDDHNILLDENPKKNNNKKE